MLNNSTSRSEYVVQSGVTQYPVGFEFFFNGDDTPQIRVTIGDMVAEENLHFVISEDSLTINLIPLEEEAPVDPNDYSWMDEWVGKELVIERDIPFVQESDYQLGRISPGRIEKDFDLSVMRDQILAGQIQDHTDDVQAEIDALNSRVDLVQEKHLLDMAEVDEALATKAVKTEVDAEFATVNADLATKATKTELANTKTVLEEGIQGNADAILETRDDYQAADQDIREDMNAKDSELETIANDLTTRLNTLRTGVDDLGDDVSDIQSKIPQSASGSNPLITKQQLLDKETDIREDLNGGLNELQTRVTAQAAAIATKAEKDSVYTKEQVDAKVSSVYTKEQVDAKVSSVYKVKGSVANYDSLPTGANVGDVYNVLDTGANYVWTTDGWDALGGAVDLTDYAKKDDLSGYLPLSGGGMTGLLALNATSKPQYSYQDAPILRIKAETEDGTSKLDRTINVTPSGMFFVGGLSFSDLGGLYPAGVYNDLGSTLSRWLTVYVQRIHNGAPIAVPTTGGTMALKEDIAAIGGDGTAGQVLTKTSTGMAWQDAASGGGDYLPLSGGTLTGELNFENSSYEYKIKALAYGEFDIITMQNGSETGRIVIEGSKIIPKGNGVSGQTLGRNNRVWYNVYTKNLNNGADIAIPTTGGTMALKEDIDAAVGDISTALTAILGE